MLFRSVDIKKFKHEIDPNKELDIKFTEEALKIPDGVEVYEIDGPYFFGIANKFDEIMKEVGDKPKVRIIRMRRVPFIDSTGIHNLEILCHQSQKEGISIILSGVIPEVRETLRKAGFEYLVGSDNICSNINEALERSKAHMAVMSDE